MTEALESFRASLQELQRISQTPPAPAAGKKKASPPALDRTLVRELLLSLGEFLEDGGEESEAAIETDLEAARACVERLGEGWNRSLETELQLACGEHIQGIDPRYLEHPRYDFDYALGARQRLEHRFLALEALGLAVDGNLLDRVAGADELLAAALEKRAQGPGSG